MANLALGIIIFMSSIYIGIILKKHYANKCKIYYEMLDFLTFVQGEIQFLGTNINQLIQKYTTENKNLLSKAMHGIKMPDNCQKTDIVSHYLTDKGKELLVDFIDGLCKINLDTQKEYIANFNNKILQEIQLSKDELENKGEMYKKLSPFVGLAIAIIIF